jgi:hypothetical protein
VQGEGPTTVAANRIGTATAQFSAIAHALPNSLLHELFFFMMYGGESNQNLEDTEEIETLLW